MFNSDIVDLFSRVSVGTPVLIEAAVSYGNARGEI
jgi:hypothetical protein